MRCELHNLIEEINTQIETISISLQDTKVFFDHVIKEKHGMVEIPDMAKVLNSYASVIAKYNKLLRHTTASLGSIVKNLDSQNLVNKNLLQ